MGLTPDLFDKIWQWTAWEHGFAADDPTIRGLIVDGEPVPIPGTCYYPEAQIIRRPEDAS